MYEVYEIELSTRATKQIRKLDSYIRGMVKKNITKYLTSDPYEYPLLSGKYSTSRKMTFSTSAREFGIIYTIRRDMKRVIILFPGNRGNFYKELQRYLGS